MRISNKGRMSLYSVFSIIAIMILCVAAWKMLDQALNTYNKMLTSKKPAKKIQKNDIKSQAQQEAKKFKKNISKPSRIHSQSNPIIQNLMKKLYLTEAKLKSKKIQKTINENEIKAIKILEKYARAQQIFNDHYGFYAKDASELIIEENNSYTIIDSDLKPLNRAYSREKAVDGYFYLESVNTGQNSQNAKGFTLNAIPDKYGLSGLNSYCITQKGIVIRKNNGAKPIKFTK